MHHTTLALPATLALAALLGVAACDDEQGEDGPTCAAWLTCYERCRLAAWDYETSSYTVDLHSCSDYVACWSLRPSFPAGYHADRWIADLDQDVADLLPAASLCYHDPDNEDACGAAAALAYSLSQAIYWRSVCLGEGPD